MVTDILGMVLMVIGLFFMLIASIGFVRFPDVFCRLHVTGVLDTLGAPTMLLGVAVQIGPSLVAGKLLLAIAFLFMTSPLVGHLLSTAALEAGHKPDSAGSISDHTDSAHGPQESRGPSRAQETPTDPTGRQYEEPA